MPERRGFTLLEMLVVITVVAVLASLVSPSLFRSVGDARQAAARAQLDVFGLALDGYRLDNDFFPSTEQGLQALLRAPQGEPPARNWRGPYLRRDVPLDPWGRPYRYESPVDGRDEYVVRTLGRDGEPGGAGEDLDLSDASAPDTGTAPLDPPGVP